MAGIKHRMHGNYPYNKNFNEITDPIERHAKFVGQMQTPFCKICGKEILTANQDEHGNSVNWEYEMEVEAHQACITKERERRMTEEKIKQAQEAQKPKKTLEEIIKEQYGVDVNTTKEE